MHICKGLENVCSILSWDCVQSTVRKRFCHRPRYIPCLSDWLVWQPLASHQHRSLPVGMICESGPIYMSASCSTDSQLGPPAASITLRMSRSAWLGTAGGWGKILRRRMFRWGQCLGLWIRSFVVLRVTKSCTTINLQVKYGNIQNMLQYAIFWFICYNDNYYMQF